MPTKINDETIEKIAILAKLKLTDREKEQAKKDMEKILNYMDLLAEVDTDDVLPSTHAISFSTPMREDEENDICVTFDDSCVAEADRNEFFHKNDGYNNLLNNAPQVHDNMFVVPATLAERKDGQ